MKAFNRMIFAILCLHANLLGCSTEQFRAEPEAVIKAQDLVDQGTVYLRLGDLDRARSSFEVAWDLARLSAALDGLGCVAFLSGDLELAQARFIKAYEMNPDSAEPIANLALLYDAVGDKTHAEKLYRFAIKLDPDNYRARNNLGALIGDKGQLLRSREYKYRAKAELLRAQALADSPLISENLERLE